MEKTKWGGFDRFGTVFIFFGVCRLVYVVCLPRYRRIECKMKENKKKDKKTNENKTIV